MTRLMADTDPPVAGHAGTGGATLRLRDLHKHYGTRHALRGIDLTLAGGQIAGIVGPDGAGKTTLIRALAGLLEITATEASVLGYDLRGDVTEFKARVGYVPQAFGLHRDLSVIENLRFAARVHRLPAEVFAARSTELLARTGLTPFTDRPAGMLSGGMKQKLAVAAALLVQPALLLLDEPTAGVDVVARAEIWAMLEQARGNALIIMSTSYLEEGERCDSLVYLDGGRVVAVGTPAELHAAVPVELYRAWGDDPRAIAVAARRLPYVSGARATGRFARIEVDRDATPGPERVVRDLRALADAQVHFAEARPLDMESALLGLARGAPA